MQRLYRFSFIADATNPDKKLSEPNTGFRVFKRYYFPTLFMAKNVLITGGTGLVGSRLTELLLQGGYQVSLLSRRKENIPGVTVYQWDIRQKTIEPEAVEKADYIIHLAGAGVADERWTDQRKRQILESRTESAKLLYESLKQTAKPPKAFISASAIGIYGADRGDELLSEESAYGNDFLATVTKAWEESVRPVADLGIRTVRLRIGIVLSEKGGALAKLAAPIKLGAGTALGSGKQWMSWIHIDDLCRMFMYALENESLAGVYNAVGPHPDTNAALTRAAADALTRPLILPNAPAFALKLAFGEMAVVVLGSARVSNQKISEAGFACRFTELAPAMDDLLG